MIDLAIKPRSEEDPTRKGAPQSGELIHALEFQGSIEAGWYLLAISIQIRDTRGGLPRLQVSYGKSAGSYDSLHLPLSPGHVHQRIPVYFKAEPVAMRLALGHGVSQVEIGRMSLRRLSRAETLARLGWPVMRDALRSPRSTISAIRMGVELFRSDGLRGLHGALATLPPIETNSYAEWIRVVESNREDDISPVSFLQDAQELPLISVLMPTYNTDPLYLTRAIDSVLEQEYTHWELCIADDASTDDSVRQLLSRYEAQDPRIRCNFRSTNGHICRASNSALEMARGDFVALLDHDDELAPDALSWVAAAAVTFPDVAILYSDEDKIDEDGIRFEPYFKPDWNPDLLLAQNFISHLGVYRTALVQEVGGFRPGYEGSQDYDLAVRCVEKIRDGQIRHIPRVLYHWRAIVGSTARDVAEKSYAPTAFKRALADHLTRTGVHGEILSAVASHFRVRFPIPDPAPTVTIIVPTRDRLDLLRTCVDSLLRRTDYPDFNVLIIDNGSTDQSTLSWLMQVADREPRVRVIRDDLPFNFSRLCNLGVARSESDVVVLMNNDIEITSGEWLREMVSQAVRKGRGVVGAKLFYPSGPIQHAGIVLGVLGVAGHAYQGMPDGHFGQMGRACLVQNMPAVTAACLAVRRETYLSVGGFDESFAVAFNDVDFCLRVWAEGYRNVWTPFAEMKHHESASRGQEDSPGKRSRFAREVGMMRQRWGNRLMLDEAYNPNLSLGAEPHSLDASSTRLTRLRLQFGAVSPTAERGALL